MVGVEGKAGKPSGRGKTVAEEGKGDGVRIVKDDQVPRGGGWGEYPNVGVIF